MGKLLRKVMALVMVVAFTGGLALPASAEATLDDILKRVEALEKENASLKAEVMALKDQQNVQATKIASVQAAPAAAAPGVGNFLKTKLETELYGFIGVSASYSDAEGATSSTANSSVAATNAPHQTIDKNVNAFNTSAQDTRLGLNIKAPVMDDGGKLSGKFEIDFAANNGPTYAPRLRLAYAQLDYEKWGVTAGQTWDFFAPINPGTLNSGVLFRGGNAGFRHPQVYLTNRIGDVPGGKLTTIIGALDSDDPYQENSGVPVVGAYAKYDTKILGKETSLGLGGIYGRNSTSVLNSKGPKTNDIYGTFLGVTTKLMDKLSLKAEGFAGSKLDDFTAGPSTGITSATLGNAKGVKVSGGFTEAVYKLTSKMDVTAGMGLDAVNGDTTMDAGYTDDIWKTNRTYYSNLKYNLSKDLMLGIEYQYFDTQYFDGIRGESNRVLSSVVYKF